MNEEKQIEERFSKEMPFKVPEKYFENFTAEMMARLPERKPKQSRWRPFAWAAACFCAAAIGVGAYLHFYKTAAPQATTAVAEYMATEASQDGDLDMLDQAADYMMFDEHDFYAYLSEE